MVNRRNAQVGSRTGSDKQISRAHLVLAALLEAGQGANRNVWCPMTRPTIAADTVRLRANPDQWERLAAKLGVSDVQKPVP